MKTSLSIKTEFIRVLIRYYRVIFFTCHSLNFSYFQDKILKQVKYSDPVEKYLDQ